MVEFRNCPDCGKEVSVNAMMCPNCGRALAQKGRNYIIYVLLAIFLGGFGINWFYVGKTMAGVLSLIFCWCGIPAIISFIHAILVLIRGPEDFDMKYNSIISA